MSEPASHDSGKRGWFAPLNPPLDQWPGRRVWVVGASSGIGLALAKALLERGASVVVSARSMDELEALVAAHPGTDREGRPLVQAAKLDSTDDASIADAVQSAFIHGAIDLMIYCAGHYQPQRATDFDLQDLLKHMQVNYDGALRMIAPVLKRFLERGSGHLSVIASVAGYRGLPQSLGYGPTKAALINLAETLYYDLRHRGIGVSVINPGFVETPLTARNEFPMPALIQPGQAAEAILAGWERGAFEIDFPKRFTVVMKLMAMLPYRLYFAAVRRATGL